MVTKKVKQDVIFCSILVLILLLFISCMVKVDTYVQGEIEKIHECWPEK